MATSFPFVLIMRAAFISFYIIRYNLGHNINMEISFKTVITAVSREIILQVAALSVGWNYANSETIQLL